MSIHCRGGARSSFGIWASIAALVGIAAALSVFAGCGVRGDCTGDTPVPVLRSISPTSVDVSTLPVTITLNGSHFVTWSKIYVNGAQAGTGYVSSGKLVATITSDTVYQGRITSGMTVPVRVENAGSLVGSFAGNALGCANGGLSEEVTLTVN